VSIPTRADAVAISVFLLDDHEIVRRGIAQLLEAEDDIEVVGEAGTAAQAMAGIPRCAPTPRSSTSACPTARASPCAATSAPPSSLLHELGFARRTLAAVHATELHRDSSPRPR
jgi:hypothetical protein